MILIKVFAKLKWVIIFIVPRHRRPRYIDYTLLRITAFIHLILGSVILILSGIVLFTLPAYAFYMTFLVGFYLFLPGVVISFGIIPRATARKWAHYMLPIWKIIS